MNIKHYDDVPYFDDPIGKKKTLLPINLLFRFMNSSKRVVQCLLECKMYFISENNNLIFCKQILVVTT